MVPKAAAGTSGRIGDGTAEQGLTAHVIAKDVETSRGKRRGQW
jgi:hypothetical protein